jgi:hypothetical protein
MAHEILGIMITKNEHRDHIVGVVKAAQQAGYSVSLFLTDEGVKFTKDPMFLEFVSVSGVKISCCDHNCKRLGLHEKTDGIYYGSQLDNALLLHASSRFLVF